MKISSFGEVLWDDFPEGKVLGGAATTQTAKNCCAASPPKTSPPTSSKPTPNSRWPTWKN